MKIRLDSARFEPYRWQETLDFDSAQLGLPEGVELTPVEVRGMLSSTSPGFLLSARLVYRQTVPCDRCLTPVEDEVESDVDLVVVERRRAASRPADTPLAEEEFGVIEVAGDAIDTAPLVVEQVQLGLPSHPLCREECAGLCPTCGKDLNEGPCSCERASDPRWAALAAWSEKKNGRGSD